MSVFTWKSPFVVPSEFDDPALQSFMSVDVPTCIFCGGWFEDGVKVFHWDAAVKIHAHAECVSERATGLLADIARCLK